MRKLMILAALVPAACSTAPAGPVAAAPASGICRNEGLDRFLGQPRSSALEAQLLAASGARVVRWVTPEMMITMDHREDRLTVRLGKDGRVGSLNCG
jgi:hypothetical protein